MWLGRIQQFVPKSTTLGQLRPKFIDFGQTSAEHYQPRGDDGQIWAGFIFGDVFHISGELDQTWAEVDQKLAELYQI